MRGSCSLRAAAQSLITLADRLCRQGNWTEAEAMLRTAASIAPSPRVQIALGTLLSRRGESAAALCELFSAWEKAKQGGIPSLRALACHQIAGVYRQMKQAVLARQFQQLAFAAALEGMKRGEIFQLDDELLVAHAADLAACGELDVAHRELSRLAVGGSTPRIRGLARLHLAGVKSCQDRPHQAISDCQVALGQFERAEDDAGMLATLELLGQLHYQCGDWPSAVTCFERGLPIAERVQHRPMLTDLQTVIRRIRHGLSRLQSNPLLN